MHVIVFLIVDADKVELMLKHTDFSKRFLMLQLTHFSKRFLILQFTHVLNVIVSNEQFDY